jgi:AraC-like DNA-binding protein
VTSPIFINPRIKHAILVEPTRIVGRTLRSEFVNIEAERPISRLLGGYVVYFSVDLPFAVNQGHGWEIGRNLVLVAPYRRHELVRCEGLRSILIEPESVCPRVMQDDRWTDGTRANLDWVARIEHGFDEWERLGIVPDRTIDQIVFGDDLPARQLDPRIERGVKAICAQPSASSSSVVALARQAGLSNSRFSHLFREELGIAVRSFRSWKRARNSLAATASEPILLHAALDAGYADEPHYSRSMRRYFGQHPHLMQRHWRRAMTFRQNEPRYA